MTSMDVKVFYRQRKSIPSPSSKLDDKSSKSSVTAFLHSPTTCSLVSHDSIDLKDDYDEYEEILRQFDLNTNYGPCLGLSRLERWQRAKDMGLNPPETMERLLKSSQVRENCLWQGRV